MRTKYFTWYNVFVRGYHWLCLYCCCCCCSYYRVRGETILMESQGERESMSILRNHDIPTMILQDLGQEQLQQILEREPLIITSLMSRKHYGEEEEEEEEGNVSSTRGLFTETSWKEVMQKEILNHWLTATTATGRSDWMGRQLDFDEFRNLFATMEFELPDFNAQQRIMFATLNIHATNVICRNMVFDDIQVNYNQDSDQRLTIEISVVNLDFVCDLDFTWTYSFFADEGHASVSSDNTNIAARLAFQSEDFTQMPPNSVAMDSCTTDINISNLEFTGGVSSVIVSVFESLVTNLVESEVGDTSCEEFMSMAAEFMDGIVTQLSDWLLPFLQPLESWILDPLYPESLMQLPDNVRVINFQDDDSQGQLGRTLLDLIREFNLYLSTWVPSSQSPTGQDLGINVFLRDTILDEDGALQINITDSDSIPFLNPSLFQGSDMLTDLSITVFRIKIFGLDSFTRFQPIEEIGKYTYQLDLAWESLTMEVDAIVDMTPVTNQEGSPMRSTVPIHIVENIQMDFAMSDVQLVASALVAIDEDVLDAFEMGPLLITDNLLPCMLSALHEVSVSGLDLTVTTIHKPAIRGFISPGLDRVLTGFIEATFQMYRNILINTMPAISQTTVRQMLTDTVVARTASKSSSSSSSSSNATDALDGGADADADAAAATTPAVCPLITVVDDHLDFRDLFLDANASIPLGGHGDERYGDVIPFVVKFLRGQMTNIGTDGLPQINSIMIRPQTRSQSGVEGMFQFDSDSFSLFGGAGSGSGDNLIDNLDNGENNDDNDNDSFSSLSGMNFLESVAFTNIRIRNLDTVVPPSDILQPKRNESYSIGNQIYAGPVPGRPLTGEMTMLLNLLGEQHEMDITVAAPSMQLFADFYAMVNSSKFLHFPIKDVFNFHCWLATMSTSYVDDYNDYNHDNNDNNNNNTETTHVGMNFTSFLTTISSLSAALECRTCSSSISGTSTFGLALQDLTRILDETQMITTFGNRLGPFIQDVVPDMMERLLIEAPRYCPHSPHYDSSSSSSNNKPWELLAEMPFSLSTESMDTAIFTGAMALQVGLVLMTNIPQEPPAANDILYKQKEFVPPVGSRILDWTNVENEEDISPLIVWGLELVRSLGDSAPAAEGTSQRTLQQQQQEQQEQQEQPQEGQESVSNNNNNNNNNNMLGGINSILDQLLVGEDGFLTISFQDNTDNNNMQFEFAGMTMGIDFIKIGGLDTFGQFDFLNAIAPQTFVNSFQMERLSLEVHFHIDHEQYVSISLDVNDVYVMIPIFLALDLDAFHDLEIGSLLVLRDIFSCLISPLVDIEILQINVTLGDMSTPVLDGLLPETDEVMSQFTNELFATFQGRMLQQSSVTAQELIRPLLNGIITNFVDSAQCHNIIVPKEKEGAEDAGETAAAMVAALANSKINADNNDNDNEDDDDDNHDDNTAANLMTIDNHIDFRDLFLSKVIAMEYGGTGEAPYGDVLRLLYQLLQEWSLPVDSDNKNTTTTTTTLSRMNANIIRPLTVWQSGEPGSLVFPGELFSEGTKIQLGDFGAVAGLKLSDVRISGIDQIGTPLSLLDIIPNFAHVLNSSVILGAANVPLQVSVRFFVTIIEKDGVQVRNDIAIAVDLYSATLVLTKLIKIVEERFAKFPVRNLFKMDCWLATLTTPMLDVYGVRLDPLEEASARIAHLAASVAKMNLHVECISCTSPGLQDWIRLLSTQAAKDDLTVATNQLLNTMTETMVTGEFLQMQIDRKLNEAARKCPLGLRYNQTLASSINQVNYQPFRKELEEASVTWVYLLISVAAVLACLALIVILFVRWIVRRRHERWLCTLPEEGLQLLQQQQSRMDERELQLNTRTTSMFMSSEEIPFLVRYSIPIIILGNIAFFLSGHLSLGATVNIEGEFAGQEINIHNFFEFSMAQSTVDVYMAGGKMLAILILIFSGIWPYSKQLITLTLWFVKPSLVSVSRRGSILLWLDFLAKWSMVDIFALVVSLVGFRISIASPTRDFLPADLYKVNLMVVPMWGLYANMTAQLISQVSSHFIIHYHRCIVNNAIQQWEHSQQMEKASTPTAAGGGSEMMECPTAPSSLPSSPSQQPPLPEDYSPPSSSSLMKMSPTTRKEKLHQHAFARPHRGESERLVVRRYVNGLLCLASLLLSTFLIMGCVFPSFSLEVLGIVGLVVEAGQGFRESVFDFSIFNVVQLIMDQARYLNETNSYIGLGVLSALFMLTVLIVPLVQTVVLLYQWFTPLLGKSRTNVSILIEILQAWQYTEVYVISVIVAGWQLGPISDWMINPYCKDFEEMLGLLSYFGFVEGTDAQCFQVQASIQQGTYFIIASAALLVFLNVFVTQATVQYFRDQEIQPINYNKDFEARSSNNNNNNNNYHDTIDTKHIRPVPTLFTDFFRWLLIRGQSQNVTMMMMQYPHDDVSKELDVYPNPTYDLGEKSADEQDDVI